MRHTTLTAIRLDASTLTAAAVVLVEDVDVDARLVSGVLVPYGPVGYTDAGPVIVPSPGRIQLPPREDWHRVKLVDHHQNPPQPVGYAVNLQDRPEGLRGQFRLSPTPDGDRILAEMTPDAHGVRARDGFSVELVEIQLVPSRTSPDVGELVTGRLSLVAAVVAPAWDSARADGLAASRNTHPTGRNAMLTDEQRQRLTELLGITPGDLTDEQNTELTELLAIANGTPAPAVQDPAPATAPAAQDAQPPAQTGQLAASRPAQLPASLPVGHRPQSRPQRDVRELFAAQARVLSGVSRPDLEAALQDITNTANIWVAGDEYGGQLWSGLTYQRRFIPLMASGELRSYKGSGWRWATKPEVADYAGDKAAVPSNEAETEDATWTAARLAGAHDIDRKFWDFGDTEFIAAYYEAMTESYAVKSDDKARAFILASATTAGAAGVGLFRAAAVAAQAVEDGTNGASVDYFLINSTDRLALLDVTSADIPAYLEAFGVTPDKFQVAAGVAAGTVVAGTRQAARFRELPGSPIRVEAINVANGGVDGGVFGYYATELLDGSGIRSATFTTS